MITKILISLFLCAINSLVFADPLPCASGQTVQFYHDTYGSTGCVIGHDVAKNFDYLLVNLATPNPVNASNIIVTPFDNAAGPDFDFAAIWNVIGAGAIESAIRFELDSLQGFYLTGVTLSDTGSRAGVITSAIVTEVDCLGGLLDLTTYSTQGLPGVACTGGGIAATGAALLPVGSSVNSTAAISFVPQANRVDIIKDVSVTSPVGGSASVTDIGQQFTQATPEPASMGLALIGFLIFLGNRMLR